MPITPQDYNGDAILGEQLSKLMEKEIRDRLKGDVPETLAHALCVMAAEIDALKAALSASNLGERVADSLDAQTLKVGGEDVTDASNHTATFSQASSRTNLTTGEKLSAIFGKIAKWFADLKTVAFTGSYDDLSEKPDLTQYIPSSQKGAANGVGTLGSNSVQPYSEMYKGYTVEGDAIFKLCRIPDETAYAAGVSFVFTSRVYDKSSGLVLLWVSPREYQDNNVVYKVVNLFSRATDVKMQFFYNKVTVAGNPYVDVYYRVYGGSSITHVMPLWMRPGVQDMLTTGAVTLPDGAVEMTSRLFNVCAAKDGVGSTSVPVHINNAGNAVPCTLATVASTGSYNDLSNKPAIPAAVTVDQTYSASSTNPQSGTAVAGAIANKQDKLGTSGSGSSLKYAISITGTAGVADKATTVTVNSMSSADRYLALVDENGNIYNGSATYNLASNTIVCDLTGTATKAIEAKNYDANSGGIKAALEGKAAYQHSHGFIDHAGVMTSTDGTFEAGDKLLFIDHNFSGANDIIRAVTNANGALYYNGTKLGFGTLGKAYGGTGETNAKAACNSFLSALDEGDSDFSPTEDPIVITGIYDASNTTSFYRRPVSKILSWIMAKIPVVIGAAGRLYAHTCKTPYSYAENNTSGNPSVDYVQYVDGNGTCYNVPCASPDLSNTNMIVDTRRIGLANGTTERTSSEMSSNGATGQVFKYLRFHRSGGIAVLSGAVCFRPIAYKIDSSGTTVLTESADWHLMVKASGSGKQFKGTSFQPVHAHSIRIHLSETLIPTTAYGAGIVDDVGVNGVFVKLANSVLTFTVDSNYDFANFSRGKWFNFAVTCTCPS